MKRFARDILMVFLGCVIFSVFFLNLMILLFLFSELGEINGCFKLYREIGATPWHRPETIITAEHSGRYSDEEIQAALDAAMDMYLDKYYSYNGVYFTELYYDDEFNCRNQDYDMSVSGKEYIYLKSTLFIGYSYDMGGSWGNGNTYSAGYWRVERMSDGTWECLGWGQG